MIVVLYYILIAASFALSSYFFIHLKALKQADLENDMIFSISYLLMAFIYFPKVCYGWMLDSTTYTKGLYSA